MLVSHRSKYYSAEKRYPQGKFDHLNTLDKVIHHRVLDGIPCTARLTVERVTPGKIHCGVFTFNRQTGIDYKNGKLSYITLKD